MNFSYYADFSSAKFSGDTDFMEANFSRSTDFKAASFNVNMSFYNATFRVYPNFRYPKLVKVRLNNKKITGVNFYNADFNIMRVSWNSLENALVFDGVTYLKLIKNFKELEQFDDADNAYYQYRQQSQANKSGVSWLSDEIWRITCGYGVKPGNTILFAVLIILIFSLIYGFGGDVPIGDAIYFSMTTFISAQSKDCKDWFPVDRYRKMADIIERLLGWLILSLFIVTLANVLIRP